MGQGSQDPAEATLAAQAAWTEGEALRLLVEGTREYAIFMLDPGGHIATWNPGAERIKGYRAEEIIGSHFSRFYPPEDVAAGKPASLLEVAAREGKYGEEGWRLRKDGTRFWASVLITALRTHDGTLLGFAKVTRDETERLRDEQERQRLLDAERAAREALEAALRLRDEFLSVAAHELKTPVTTLRGFAQIVLRQRDKTGTVDPSLVTRALMAVDTQTLKLTRMVEQLLDVSRLEVGKLALERQPTDLLALVRDIVDRLQAADAQPQVAVHPGDGASRGLVADVDPLRIEQIVVNLVSNALKYSYGPHGGVHVEVSRVRNEAHVAVTDRGIGIPEEHRPYIFDRYYQAHTEDHLSGLGLGLYVSREIARMHGGELRAEHPPAGGTRFVLSIPVDSPE